MKNPSQEKSIRLSDRELQILELIVMEKTSGEISNQLFVAPDTIKSHRKNIMAKLGALNMAGMVRRAYEAGLIRLNSDNQWRIEYRF